MKLFISAALLLSSSLVFAMPTVGDFADYDGVATKGDQTAVFDYTTMISAFDAATQNYTLHTVLTYNGKATPSDSPTASNQLYSEANVASILANCASVNGSLQNLVTAAGTFNTCAAPITGSDFTGTIWIASVPFGFAKMTQVKTSSGQTTTIALKSFTFGK